MLANTCNVKIIFFFYLHPSVTEQIIINYLRMKKKKLNVFNNQFRWGETSPLRLFLELFDFIKDFLILGRFLRFIESHDVFVPIQFYFYMSKYLFSN